MNTKLSSTRRLRVAGLLAAAVLLAVAGQGVFGQVQQVVGGRALDANNQVGSGGANRPVPGFTPINGNEVVTGNVAGLKYFHGNVPYRSTYDFGSGSSAPSDRFYRTSAGDGPGAYNSGAASSYYSAVTTVSRGQYGFNPGAIGGGYEARYIPRTAISPTSPTGALGNSTIAGSVPLRSFDRLDSTGQGQLAIPLEQPGGALSSPLFGLRTDLIEESRSVDGRTKALNPGATESEGIRTKDGSSETNIPRNIRPGEEKLPEGATPDLGSSARIDGQLPKTGATSTLLTAKDEMVVSDAYKTLMGALKQAEEENVKKVTLAESKLPKTTDTVVRPGTDPSLAANVASDVKNNPRIVVDPLTGLSWVVRDGSTTGVAVQSEDPAALNYVSKGDLKRLDIEAMARLQAASALPPVESLASKKTGGSQKYTPFDELMLKAERMLNQEKYFEAADEYQAALVLQPKNPLALVGRGHAQLGAGLYESAAWDLKYLFTNKPELTSLRYQLGQFMAVKRQEELLKNLMTLTVKKDAGNTASFLYCYLCYQTGREDLMKQELDRWGNREWADGWQTALTRAWVK